MTRVTVWGLLGVMVVLQGCPMMASLEEYRRYGIGLPIENKKETMAQPGSEASRIGWQERTYPLENGNWVFVEPDVKDCFIHWEVNPQGIIVGSRLEGRGCHGH